MPACARCPLQLIDRRIADAAGRHIDDPAQAHDISGIMQHPQIGDDVLDLFAVVEPQTAEDPVRDAPVPERIFQGARLGVGAVEDRDLAQAPALVDFLLDGPADVARLVLLVRGLVAQDLLAAALLGPELLRFSCRGCALPPRRPRPGYSGSSGSSAPA